MKFLYVVVAALAARVVDCQGNIGLSQPPSPSLSVASKGESGGEVHQVKEIPVLLSDRFLGLDTPHSVQQQLNKISANELDFDVETNSIEGRRPGRCFPTNSCNLANGHCFKKRKHCNGTVYHRGCTGSRRCKCCVPGSYIGTYIGKLSTLSNDVTGDVYAIDNITLYVRGFSYDGEAPAVFFFSGNNTLEPSNRGFIIPDEKGMSKALGRYRNKNLILKFPITKMGQRYLNNVQWISVWCKRFAIDFGHVKIPADIKWPAPEVSTGLQRDKPLLYSKSVTIKDNNSLFVEDFTYDATVQDAIFVMGSGDAHRYQMRWTV